MIEFISKSNDPWVATTSGERLLFLLLRYHREWAVLSDVLTGAEMRLAGRYRDLSNFFVGASVLYLMQRMVKLAIVVKKEEIETREEQIAVLRKRLSNQVRLTPLEYGAFFGELVEETLTSAEQACKQIPLGIKTKVDDGAIHCYSCGAAFYVTELDGSEPLKPSADHVWPRSLGGDSNFENLLPACDRCNREKENMAGWQMAWIQPAVFADEGGLGTLGRNLKIALHMRAAMAYAHQNGSTLRDAYLAIGARTEPTLLDEEQGCDFFNLRVHDETATNVNWRPA